MMHPLIKKKCKALRRAMKRGKHPEIAAKRQALQKKIDHLLAKEVIPGNLKLPEAARLIQDSKVILDSRKR